MLREMRTEKKGFKDVKAIGEEDAPGFIPTLRGNGRGATT